MMNIVLYCCILFPILRIQKDLFNLITNFFFCLIWADRVDEEEICSPDLPIIRFGDLQERRHRSVDEMCFVCSREYDEGDVVSQLSRCGHVFHTDCLGKLVHRKQNSCPFCRSAIFSVPPMPCKSF